MVLHLGDDDLVIWEDKRLSKRGGDEVDRLGRPFSEDDLLTSRSSEKGACLFPNRGIEGSRMDRRSVDRAVDGAILLAVETGDRLDDGAGLHRGRRCVEVDEGMAMDLLSKGRELVLNLSILR